MKFFAAFVIFIGAASLKAQTPIVPDQMEFAGISLIIRDDAKKEIQKDVNLLTQHAGYFSVKTDRAKMFFPLIEKIFEEEGVPTDFKFLALQESSLVADAVSSSNAVGFWQFKDFTALEVGLRVDEHVDERMNVISATKGAAKYLTKNNLQLNNWLFTLQSYQMGVGGVKKAVTNLQSGAAEMEVTSATYWYVKRFLAHKIAFENNLQGEPSMKLIPYTTAVQKTLNEIAKELSVEEPVLKDYNKWLKAEFIPEDKPYTVIVPVGRLNPDFNKLWLASSTKNEQQKTPQTQQKEADSVFFINGIKAIYSKPNETITQLASRAKIELDDFIRFNEVEISFHPMNGTIFFLDKKKNNTFAEYHKSKKGESLWYVSQTYGIKLKKLQKYNGHLKSDEPLIGEIIWLASKHPEVVESNDDVAELNKSETFDWVPSETKSNFDTARIKVLPTEVKVNRQEKKDSSIVVKVAPSIEIGGKWHTVLPKETLYSIANQYQIKITDLLKWNELNINDKLKPGQVIALEPASIPTNSVLSAGEIQPLDIHEVKPSDTLYSIARQYGVTIRNLMEWNNKKDFALTLGERLLIRKN